MASHTDYCCSPKDQLAELITTENKRNEKWCSASGLAVYGPVLYDISGGRAFKVVDGPWYLGSGHLALAPLPLVPSLGPLDIIPWLWSLAIGPLFPWPLVP